MHHDHLKTRHLGNIRINRILEEEQPFILPSDMFAIATKELIEQRINSLISDFFQLLLNIGINKIIPVPFTP